MIRAHALSAIAAGVVLLAGCGGESEPNAVYQFRLDAAPVSLAAAETCAPLAAVVAVPVDKQYEDIAGSQKRWDKTRQPVESLLRQGLERLAVQTRAEVCNHPTGRKVYGELADACAALARTLGASRDPWVAFAAGLEPEEILAAGIAPPRSRLAEERDKAVDAMIAKIDGLVARTARARVEQARLFLAAGDGSGGLEAAADARALITEFKLTGDEVDRITADAAKLGSAPAGG